MGRCNLLEINGTDSPLLINPLRELKGSLRPAYWTRIGPNSQLILFVWGIAVKEQPR
jgi:hypothetical protein